ncbi:hypothetical protein T03_15678 [Trichinella britovi]|uniref:Uncharacterized protein n=1 Tax=Trichinella britovi TaxID=45882 RepID=A0A0V1CJP3_TRIBR|nr:hypothetical protein T03_15678 [Trichinella britovi]
MQAKSKKANTEKVYAFLLDAFGRNNFKLFHAIVCEANFSMLAYFPRNTDLMTDTNLRKEFSNNKCVPSASVLPFNEARLVSSSYQCQADNVDYHCLVGKAKLNGPIGSRRAFDSLCLAAVKLTTLAVAKVININQFKLKIWHVKQKHKQFCGYHSRCAFWPHASLAEADQPVSLAFINNACRFVGLSMGSAVKAAFPSLMR